MDGGGWVAAFFEVKTHKKTHKYKTGVKEEKNKLLKYKKEKYMEIATEDTETKIRILVSETLEKDIQVCLVNILKLTSNRLAMWMVGIGFLPFFTPRHIRNKKQE